MLVKFSSSVSSREKGRDCNTKAQATHTHTHTGREATFSEILSDAATPLLKGLLSNW
jgi:hypothetical protein